MSSAPGKVMLAGEYAVLDGAAAIVAAVDRRARAYLVDEPQPLSPFLAAVRDIAQQRFGPAAARRACHTVVDSSRLADTGGVKLGLGSSAAATVAATGLALGEVPQEVACSVAFEAHATAQARRGAAGSGADVAASTHGGIIRVRRGCDWSLQVTPVTLPPSLQLLFIWTGTPARTTTLVPLVRRLHAAAPDRYQQLITAIADAADHLAETGDIAAIRAGGAAVRALGEAAGVALWLPAHSQLAALAEPLGGTVKPTGAGGGDIALAAFDAPDAAEAFRKAVPATGMKLLDLRVEDQGLVTSPTPT